MFDGNEQFHQFIASSRTSLPISLPFPLHENPSFDSYAPPPPPLHPSAAAKNIDHDESKKYPQISTNLALERERSTDPWSNDELLALLKVRSSMELWFPDFNWEHVSRKLGELGYKRSGDQCKDKFEEESRHFNNTKNYRILSEFDEFYQEQPPISTHEEVEQQKLVAPQMKKVEEMISRAPENPEIHQEIVTKKSSKKRKRKDKLEMLKGFCEEVVKKMMAKQEELHNKLIQDIIKMDQEKIAREEAWKNQEMDRIKTEIETRTKDQKSAAERQATIIQFLKHFTSDQEQQQQQIIFKNKNCSNSNSNSCASFPQTQNHDHDDVATPPPPPPPPPSMIYQNPPPPSSPSNAAKDSTPLSEGGEIGKRWPRDEVVALINLRCKMSGGGGGGGGGDQESSSSGGKEVGRGPLWERISVGMRELGYKRSAKRCKEKWENINKYFRKTKDSSKKRSLNSRTCPYFHHLSSLYSDGTIVAPTVNDAAAPEM